MFKNKKIFYGVLISMVLVAGGYMVWQYWGYRFPPEIKVPEEEVVEDETADWQTYRNEEWGFEVKYPEGWIVEEKLYGSAIKIQAVQFKVKDSVDVYGRIILIEETTRSASEAKRDWEVEFYPPPNQFQQNWKGFYDILEEGYLLIDGVAAKRITGSLKTNLPEPGGILKDTFILLPGQEMSYILAFSKEDSVLMNLMLSTFKFIE